jgi:hypothetical protein
MMGYANSEEQQKAAEVRKLIYKANILKRKAEANWEEGIEFEDIAKEYYQIK